MKTVLSALAILLIATVGAQAANSTSSPAKPAPRRGMTKTQVLALYGRPRHSAQVDGQEVWYYRLKLYEVYGRTMVPFEFSSENVRFGEIAFNEQGKAAHIIWNHGGPSIAVIR